MKCEKCGADTVVPEGGRTLEQMNQARNDAIDAARYRYLKDNRRLLNITIEAYHPTRKTVQGADADACIDWYMEVYPLSTMNNYSESK